MSPKNPERTYADSQLYRRLGAAASPYGRHLAALFIFVETTVQEFSQKPPALGYAKAMCPLHNRLISDHQRIVFSDTVFECRNQVTQ